ncbi:hypothetical protein [Pseudomonas mandelii]|jgi:hypothetical protein|uniref:Uncharacterized protein n=2 Tax=Pseudomonas mandelii TaxID=75612 RepID=A0ABY0VUP7_9PSED|nr:hypothetical protein [Pseudomonas mandelii]SDU56241.1 hypothetical protein SAMN04489801_4445 [Pseudomonas mandelii]
MTSQGERVSAIVEAFDDIILGYVLKKLTEVFEALMAASKKNHPDNMTGLVEMGRVKAAKKIPAWLNRVKHSMPSQVTRVLLEQMSDSQKSKHDLRFEAQAVLFEVLVEESLAMDAASYAEWINKSAV